MANAYNFILAYQFFKTREERSAEFTLAELLSSIPGWKQSTFDTYYAKKLKRFLTKTDIGYRVEGIAEYTQEQFVRFMSQKQEFSYNYNKSGLPEGFVQLAEIGSGAFGKVIKVRDEAGEIAAMKIFSGGGFNDVDRERFGREVRILSGLKHENVLPLIADDLDADPPWFTMPLARACLQDIIEELSDEPARRDNIFKQILQGVKHIHDNDIIHRDLKPQNILVFGDDHVKIADFGLGKRLSPDTFTASLTSTGQEGGTRCYQSPQQQSNIKRVDKKSDIYALGVILCVMITGDDDACDCGPEDVDSPYDVIIAKCKQQKPDRRYQTIDELIEAFEQATGEGLFQRVGDRVEYELNEAFSHPPSEAGGQQIAKALLNPDSGSEEYFQYFPKIKGEWLDIFQNKLHDKYFRMLKQYNSYIAQTSLPFDYTDIVGDLYREIFLKYNDLNIKKIVLSTILDISYQYNRWHVQDIFSNLLNQINDSRTAFIAGEVIKENPYKIQRLEEKLKKIRPLKYIMQSLERAFALFSTTPSDDPNSRIDNFVDQISDEMNLSLPLLSKITDTIDNLGNNIRQISPDTQPQRMEMLLSESIEQFIHNLQSVSLQWFESSERMIFLVNQIIYEISENSETDFGDRLESLWEASQTITLQISSTIASVYEFRKVFETVPHRVNNESLKKNALEAEKELTILISTLSKISAKFSEIITRIEERRLSK